MGADAPAFHLDDSVVCSLCRPCFSLSEDLALIPLSREKAEPGATEVAPV